MNSVIRFHLALALSVLEPGLWVVFFKLGHLHFLAASTSLLALICLNCLSPFSLT